MKNLKFLFILLLCYVALCAQAQIVDSKDIARHEGENITVCDLVASSYITKKEKPTIFLNFGERYPNQLFVGVIFYSAIAKFSYNPATFLEGKDVCLSGKVKLYKGMSEIIINNPSQVQIMKK